MKGFIKRLLREGLLDEEAMRYDKLSEGTGLFIKTNNSGAELVLFNPSINKVYGTITFISNVNNGPYHYVSGVAAEKGFGPFIYELAMMWCNQNGSMLMPSRDGTIEKEAWVVWTRFYDRTDIIKDTLDLYDSAFKFDMIYPDESPIDDYERKEMWNDSNGKDKKTLLIFNTGYSIKPDNDYSVLIKKANEYPEKIYDKAFKLGDKFFTFNLFKL